MITTFNIPLRFNKGKYSLPELPIGNDNSLELLLDEYNVLSYSIPEHGTKVRVYSVMEQMLKDTLLATYGENGQLEKLEIFREDKAELVYIHFDDCDSAQRRIHEFADLNASKISEEIILCKEKVARLFIEYFYDGDAVDYAAKVCTVADTQTAIEKYGGELDVVDYSGNYPVEKRIECDSDTLRIMLLCAAPNFRDELLQYAVHEITNGVKERVLKVIDRADGFKFIEEEYD